MGKLTRRHFVKSVGAVGVASSVLGWPAVTLGSAGGHVVVIGGGFGGASCAKYLRRIAPDIQVTLVETNSNYMTCPFSNAVLGGLYDMDFITHGYDALQSRYGARVIHDSAVAIDAVARKVTLAGGETLPPAGRPGAGRPS